MSKAKLQGKRARVKCVLRSRASLSALSIAMCALMLTACASRPKPSVSPTVTQANLLQPCPKLPEPKGETMTGGETLSYLVDVIGLYGDCRARHEALAKAVQVK